MLTNEDIQKLIEVFPTKDEVALKSDIEELRDDFVNLQTSIDCYAKKADTGLLLITKLTSATKL